MALLITETDVAELISPSDALTAVRSAHEDLAMGQAVNVVRSRARLPKMSLHALSAASESIDAAAVKVYTALRGRMQSILLLYRASSGELIATIEANTLGQLRTAATSVLAALTLLDTSVETLGIIGAGFQAEGVCRAYRASASELGLKRIILFRRTTHRLAEFIARQPSDSVPLEAACSAEELVHVSDLIVTVTTSSTPVLEKSWLRRVRHISALGSNALSRRELPGDVVTSAHTVVVDLKAVAESEGGNLLSPFENGKLNWAKIKELGPLLQTPPEGRTSSGREGYSVFLSHGVAAQDLYLGALAFERARGQGRGEEIPLS